MWHTKSRECKLMNSSVQPCYLSSSLSTHCIKYCIHTLPSIMENADVLAKRMQALPQELCDQIHRYVLTPDPFEERQINSWYKPPIHLHISRTIRDSFAREYYSKTAFTFYSEDLFMRWCDSLPAAHKAMLRQVYFVDSSWLTTNHLIQSDFQGTRNAGIEQRVKQSAKRLLIRLRREVNPMNSQSGCRVEIYYETPGGSKHVLTL